MQTRPSLPDAPVIGVCGVPTRATWGFWSQDAVLTARTYLDALERAGAQTVILPPRPTGSSARLLNLFDGLVLAGGTDLDPDVYDAPPSERTEETCRDRDLFELAVARTALERDVPILGICRGLQVLNVATGGTLYQHLLHHGFAEHRPEYGRLDAGTNHLIAVEADSLLGQAGLGPVREVNSHHHQGVAQVGTGGRVVARSVPDGAIEAVEWPSSRFALGVQWHPEDPPMPELFEALVAHAARGGSSAPTPGPTATHSQPSTMEAR